MKMNPKKLGTGAAALLVLTGLAACTQTPHRDVSHCQLSPTNNVDRLFAEVADRLEDSSCHYSYPEYRARLNAIFDSPRDDEIYAVYPTADFPSVADAWRIFWSDWRFNCVAEELARSASGNTPAYLYNFSRGFSSGSRAGQGAVHAIDVPFLFETYDVFGHTPDADDAAVTDAMQNAWTGLAGDPTTAPPYFPSSASAWPAFDINDIQIVNFNAPMTIDTVHREGRCTQLRNVISL